MRRRRVVEEHTYSRKVSRNNKNNLPKKDNNGKKVKISLFLYKRHMYVIRGKTKKTVKSVVKSIEKNMKFSVKYM